MQVNMIKNRAVYYWAISQSYRHFEEVEKKFPRINEWVSGEKEPSIKQLKSLSEFLAVPFGIFFLEILPDEDFFEVEFRTIKNKTQDQISKNLKDTLIEIAKKKDWLSEYRKEEGWEKIDFDHSFSIKSEKQVSEFLYRVTNLNPTWNFNIKTTEQAFKELRSIIETELHISVMVNGVVGENNKRKLEINEFRAFALSDEYAPLIFINRNDSYTGMIFSLLHELVHILMGRDDIVLPDSNLRLEQLINKGVAEFLMPSEVLQNISENIGKWNIETIKSYALKFKCSPHALAIKLYNLNYIDQDTVLQVEEKTKEALKLKDKSGGGNYYATKLNRLGNNFIETVIFAAESGKLNFNFAFKLIESRGKTYDSIKKEIGMI